MAWIILFAVVALYGFIIIGHFAAKYQRKKVQATEQEVTPITDIVRKPFKPYISDEQMREMMEAALRRMKESEKRAEEAQAARPTSSSPGSPPTQRAGPRREHGAYTARPSAGCGTSILSSPSAPSRTST